MRHSMRTLLCIKRLKNLRKQILIVHYPFFFVQEPKKTMKLTTDTLDCDIILVNQENDSVLKTVRSGISKGKLTTSDVESRQCKGLLGYANRFEKFCWQRNTISLSQEETVSSTDLLTTNLFHWSVECCTLLVHPDIPVLKKLFHLWNDFSIGLECLMGTNSNEELHNLSKE